MDGKDTEFAITKEMAAEALKTMTVSEFIDKYYGHFNGGRKVIASCLVRWGLAEKKSKVNNTCKQEVNAVQPEPPLIKERAKLKPRSFEGEQFTYELQNDRLFIESLGGSVQIPWECFNNFIEELQEIKGVKEAV